MLLTHQTNISITNIYSILQSGYLKSGKDVKKKRLIGNYPLSKYVFLNLKSDDIKPSRLPHFEFSIDLLLDNIFYLNIGENGGPSRKSVRIIGSQLNKKQLIKILKNYVKKIKKFNFSHEIVLENKIDLKKYLYSVRIDNKYKKYKTYDKLIKLINKKYSDIKIE